MIESIPVEMDGLQKKNDRKHSGGDRRFAKKKYMMKKKDDCMQAKK